MPQTGLEDLGHTLGVPAERVAEVIERTCAPMSQEQYYVFKSGSRGHAAAPHPRQPRTIVAFPNPDDALAFAQRNGYAVSPRLRLIGSRDLIALLLRDPDVGLILFVESTGDHPRGLPRGIRITRQSLLDQIAMDHPKPMELTARAYDALQFGIDFSKRGAFRAALTEAVEAVVASYVPPPGSLDRGPRSVYATGAVEAWLRNNGFPRAAQRRWIDVAGQPNWAGAEELYEIDCGTEQRLFVQLLIYSADDRQYIGRVVVTS